MALAETISQLSAQIDGFPTWLLLITLVWTFVWKGIALWKSARLSQKIWFVALLVINTFGILEILYIFIFSKLSFNHLAARKAKRRR